MNGKSVTGFRYQAGELHGEAVPLTQVAERFGTPCYVYSRASIEQAYGQFAQALDGLDHQICYAVKANHNLAVLNVLARLGAGFDIVSGGELARVLRAGGDAQRVVFSGVGKSRDDIAMALKAGIGCFNLESAAELDLLESEAQAQQCVANVAVRVNPDVDPRTHPYISTGLQQNKFGVSVEQAIALCKRAQASRHLQLYGIGCHIGSQITDLAPLTEAFASMIALGERLRGEGCEIGHLDLGGGLGVRYHDEQPIGLDDYGRAIKRMFSAHRDYRLLFEPGRRIVASAGVLLTRVMYLKQQGAKHFAIVDAAMNDLIRPALYQAWHGVLPVQKETMGRRAAWDIVGPVCESGDFLATGRTLPLQVNDLLALTEAGAYAFVMSSNYNARNRIAEVMVDGDQAFLARRRETIDDQLALESMLPPG